jgi:hypothetical protein
MDQRERKNTEKTPVNPRSTIVKNGGSLPDDNVFGINACECGDLRDLLPESRALD